VDVDVVATADQREVLARFRAALDAGTAVVVTDPTWAGPLADAARAAAARAHEDRRLGAGRMAVFTSGSAGAPGGVVRTHASWTASIDPLTALLGLTAHDVVWTPGPLWSSLSLYGAWHATTLGAGTVLAGEDPRAATVVHCVPSALPAVLDAAPPALRAVVLAGEPVTPAHREACRSRGWHLHEYYGAAELSFVGWSPDGLPWRPFPGVEVELRRGEAWVRSPYLADGYLDDAPRPLRTDADGWATVGDHATVLHGGFAVTGRGDAAISTGGHTVVAEHVEAVLASVPGVTGVLVVGTPEGRLGEVVTAVLAGTPSAADLRSALSRLAPPARPRRWAVLPEIPRTSAGKPDRAAVRAAVRAGTLRAGALR
jgi:acyl-CoA synthetase (AMP-forming)/AMP-acid ligase II